MDEEQHTGVDESKIDNWQPKDTEGQVENRGSSLVGNAAVEIQLVEDVDRVRPWEDRK